MRVYELAKDLNLDSRRLIALMRRLGLDVKNHMSTLDDETIVRIRDIVSGKASHPAKAVAKPSGGSPVGGQPPQPKRETSPEKPARPAPVPPKAELEAPAISGTPAARSTFVPPSALRSRAASAPVFEGHVRSQGPADRRPAAPPEPMLGFEPPRRSGGGGAGRRPGRGQDRQLRKERENLRALGKMPRRRRPSPSVPARTDRTVVLDGPMTVSSLSQRFGIPAADIIKQLMSLGTMATINQEVDLDTAEVLAVEFGVKVEVKAPKDDLETTLLAEQEDDPASLRERPPVVSVMGHVDHGKTSLLDALRETRMTEKEFGGITQHIGAFSVPLKGRRVVFLDTPGHEAFTSMRARGAQLSDIAVLVVAADDGVMPQTIEAINHAKAANVPIVVAINKIDKADANPDRVKQQLAEHELVPEEWGGSTVMVPVSARSKEGLDQLLEMLLLVADVQDLKANPDKPARGRVVEARLDRGRGPVATILVQSGALKVGDSFVVGSVFGRVRALLDDKGRQVKKATPSMPVEVVGLPGVPDAGDLFVAVKDERLGRQLAQERADEARRRQQRATSRSTLQELYQKIQEGEMAELRLILKGDVHGSVEPLKDSLERLSTEQVKVTVLHDGVGGITESDVSLAQTSDAIIIGFNVRPDAGAKRLADREGVDVRTYRVIYDVLSDVEAAMKGLLEPETRDVVVGRAEVRQVFRIPRVGTVAGLYVTEGKMLRNASIRVLRDGAIVHEGKIDSLKRFKDDVREVATGMECGLGLEKFQDVREGDIFEAVVVEEVPVT